MRMQTYSFSTNPSTMTTRVARRFSEPITIIKCALMGAGGQGKSALTLRYITDTFLSEYEPTIEDTYRKNVTVKDQSALIEILDTAGQEVFWSMQDQWIVDSKIFMLCFAINDEKGFKKIDTLRTTIFEVRETRDIPFILVGTKSDLANKRTVSKEEAQKKATELDCEYVEVSALNRSGIDALFEMVIPLYNKYYGENIGFEHQLEEQTTCNCSCTCFNCFASCCQEVDDDDWEYDYDAKHINLNSTKLKFYKQDPDTLPPDIIPEPILSLKNFRIARQFYSCRALKACFCILILPIILIYQTLAFLTYSERHQGDHWFYPGDEFPYDDIHDNLLWDYLGILVGRKPGQDPEAKKDRKWFLRQTEDQIFKRVVITFIVCVVYVICIYNISQMKAVENQASLMETVGPLVVLLTVWLLLSAWIGYEQRLKPPIPAPTRLRSLAIFFGETFSHRSTVYKFARAFESSRTNNRWKLTKLRTFVVICLGISYAIIPGLVRVAYGDSTDEHQRDFFSNGDARFVQIGALVVNFISITAILYAMEIQYKKQFDNYREWMSDLTMLLNKSSRTTADTLQIEEMSANGDSGEMQSGSEINKELFISLMRRQNALGWMEIRSFLAVQGTLLFGEQEMPTLWMMLMTCTMAVYCFYRAIFFEGDPRESILFWGMCLLTIICILMLIRILITAYQFEGLQKQQEKLITQQKFFMRCNRPYDDEMLDSRTEVQLSSHKSQPSIPLTLFNPLHRDSVHVINLAKSLGAGGDGLDSTNAFSLKKAASISRSANDKILKASTFTHGMKSSSIHRHDDDGDNKNMEEVALTEMLEPDHSVLSNGQDSPTMEDQRKITVPLKGDDSLHKIHVDSADDDEVMESGDDEKAPLLQGNGAWKQLVAERVIKIDENGRYSYNVDFVEDLLILVKNKDIFPRLFKMKLNSILSKVVAALLVAATAVVFRLFRNYYGGV